MSPVDLDAAADERFEDETPEFNDEGLDARGDERFEEVVPEFMEYDIGI
jgi:hypothetical protein